MKTEFSFNYAEKQYVLLAENNARYELEEDIAVEVVCRHYPEFHAAYWMLCFENKSDHNSEIISDILDCDTLLPLTFPGEPRAGHKPVRGDACVITMNGMVDGRYYWENDAVSATEYNFSYEYLDKAPKYTKRFANLVGRSSEGTMPFFDVTANGRGYITAVGWTGDWKAEFSKEPDGIRMKSGLKETAFYLKPGEKIRTTSVLVMQYASATEKYNQFRRLIKKYFSPQTNAAGSRDGLMAYELWGGLSSEEMKKRINELKAYDIRFEDAWLDAGWYGHSTDCNDPFTGDWGQYRGEWVVNPCVHPEKLMDVVACAKEAGMKLMLWFEPERAREQTSIVQAHPEWFIKLPNEEDLYLNYGNPEAAEYVFDLLSGYVEALDLSCYRQDFNGRLLTKVFRQHDEENRRGITEIKHITGMYRLWDKLLEKYPHLMIDNCASGGRRIDIETLKRSVPFFRSDYQCNFNEEPEVLQTHNANISCYLPYNGCTSKTKSDTYAIRSSYSASWGGAFYNGIFQSMNDADFKWAKKVTDEYKKIRSFFSKDFYNHGSCTFDTTAWAIWQYHDPDTQSGMVMAFRRKESPFDRVSICLKGLEENETYVFENLDSGALTESSAVLPICLPEKRSCTIITYHRKDKYA